MSAVLVLHSVLMLYCSGASYCCSSRDVCLDNAARHGITKTGREHPTRWTEGK